jgi:hypothetical protein
MRDPNDDLRAKVSKERFYEVSSVEESLLSQLADAF